ncbi:50S ribosomal protein L5 [Spiroplasma endosymbiont of Asaphidion curtum]|uniref:50S ribosomal protein L5 n=1 Tax=Spiroplasma endosymbiont of Asaphidion curtum TaxID=3066281 RepID=UPI003CC7A112
MNYLQKQYQDEIIQAMMQEYNFTSTMQVSKIIKVVVNVGIGDAVSNSKYIEIVMRELYLITGQKPVITRAKKSIASFKLREGMPIGCKVTLRGTKMYDFLYKLFNINLPRVRDFRGLNKAGFDKHGNYTLGIKEQLIFPEIDYDKVVKTRGMSITIVISSNNQNESFSLLKKMDAPFKK